MSESLSIVIPCYNEGEKLEKNLDLVFNYIEKNHKDLDYEIILVNDGSTDNTKDILINLEKEHRNIVAITYSKNRGKGYAVKQGILKTSKNTVIFMDADLSTNIEAISKSLEEIKNSDIVIGSRRHFNSILIKTQKLPRRIIGKICSVLTQIIVPIKLTDTQCGFKAFKGDVVRELAKMQTIEKFAFDVELLYIAYLNNIKISEIGVKWENDEDSKVGVVGGSIEFFIDLFKIRFNKNKYFFNK